MIKQRVQSTYRREFSPERSAERPSVVLLVSAYSHYREYRRQLEQGHQRSPFIWDDWEFDAEETEHGNKKGAVLRSPHNSSTSSSNTVANNISSDKGKDQVICGSRPRGGHHKPPSHDQESQTVDRRQEEGSDTSDSSDCDCMAKNQKLSGSGKRSKNISKAKTCNTRSATQQCNVSRKSAPVAARTVSPFAQYGHADEEERVGDKRTHNIQAQNGIYCSALRAKDRMVATRELLRSIAMEKGRTWKTTKERPHRKTTLFDPMFDQKMNSTTKNWQSEYGVRYCHHPGAIYARNVSHRPPF